MCRISERTPAAIAQKIAWIREGAGDRFDQVELVLRMPSAFVGPVDRIVELMQARREEYGFSYYVVSDRAMDAFAPVVDKLTDA